MLGSEVAFGGVHLVASGFEQFQVWVFSAFKWVRVTGTNSGVIFLILDEAGPLLGVGLTEQAVDRFLGGGKGVAIVKVAVGKGEVHGLIHGMNVLGTVIAHGL